MDEALKVYPHSDTGNGELLNDLFGDSVRYDAKTDRWLKWHENLYWKPMNEVEVYSMAVKTARHRRFEIGNNLSGPQAIKEVSFAIRSENVGAIDSMLRSARSQKPIGNPDIQWDNQPNLLAVSNGVINLSTGELRPGMRSDFLTMGLDLPYIPDLPTPIWDKFISDIMCGDRERIEFLQRAIGYTFTGFTKAQVFFILFGDGSNGKSVLTETLSKLLGGFSSHVRFEAFEDDTRSDAYKDLAELPGVRTAFSTESSIRASFKTNVIKLITGNDPITVSKKYGHPFTYTPQFKLWFSTNHLPKVDDDSFGFWRRVILIPFEARFDGPNRDNNMKNKLYSELPGILAWAVRGAAMWSKEGLSTPDSMLLRVNEYKTQEDIHGRFILECIQEKLGGKVYARDLMNRFREWTENPNVSERQFFQAMRKRLESNRDKDGVYYKDIEIRYMM